MVYLDVEFPKNCNNCWALDDNGDYPMCLITKESRGYTFNTKENRMPNCPLLEVTYTTIESTSNYKTNIPKTCLRCPNHPVNGGTGICHCVIGSQMVTY